MEKTKDFTSGSVLGSLIKFAVPVFAAMFLQSLYGGADLLIVGQFSQTADVSGVSSGSILIQTLTMVITGLSMGITVFVGQKIGEKKPEEAGEAIGSGVALFALIGIILSIILAVFADAFTGLLHAPQEALQQTSNYIRICGGGAVFIVLYNLLGAIFRGIGDSKTPLITVCIACVLNILGDLLLIAVFDMGSAGAAIATVSAQAVSVIISLFFIMRKKLPFAFHKSYIRFNGYYIGKEFKLGFPIALQEFLVGISFLLIQTVVNSINLSASAGVGVAEKVCAFIMLVPSAFSQSMSAFVAQNIGAGLKDRARKALKCGILSSLAVACVIGTFTFLRGDLLASIFSKDAAVILQAHDYLKAYAIDTFLTSFLFCFIGYYNGCGNTFFVMIQGLVGAMLVRVPIVFLMSRIPDASLFQIGLATPSATIVQIIMCLAFLGMLKKKEKNYSQVL